MAQGKEQVTSGKRQKEKRVAEYRCDGVSENNLKCLIHRGHGEKFLSPLAGSSIKRRLLGRED